MLTYDFYQTGDCLVSCSLLFPIAYASTCSQWAVRDETIMRFLSWSNCVLVDDGWLCISGTKYLPKDMIALGPRNPSAQASRLAGESPVLTEGAGLSTLVLGMISTCWIWLFLSLRPPGI